MVDTLARLREHIRSIEGRPAVDRGWMPSGLPALDACAGGLPRPGLIEVVGPVGGGRTRLALALAAAATAQHPLLWVDPQGTMFPPTAAALGVRLDRLVVVRPPLEHLAWTVEQALRSGAFPLVVLDGPAELPGAAARWGRTAQLGASTLCVVADQPGRDFVPAVRLVVMRGVATVQRHRSGRIGQSFPVPAWPQELDPWAR